MLIDRVVVNASPLICLSKSDQLDLLPELFSEMVIPDKVEQEIKVKSGVDISLLKNTRKASDILIPQSVTSWDLGEGESSVLAFALKHPGFWAVIDDREARRCAASLGCLHTGTVGVIFLAKKRGIITSVKEALVKLQNSGLWLSGSFVAEICRQAGE